MKRKKPNLSPSTRLKIGASLLNSAQVVDVNGVKPRLDAFALVHSGYADAQRKVDEAEQAVRAEQLRVDAVDADQNEAIDALALGLANDKQPLRNTFSAFSDFGPGTIKNMPPADKVKAVRAVVTLVQRNKALSKATLSAAQKVADAAQKVETALVPLDELRAKLSTARELRDATAQQWDRHLNALRHWARAASALEAPGLFDMLFGRPASPKRSKAVNTPVDTEPAKVA